MLLTRCSNATAPASPNQSLVVVWNPKRRRFVLSERTLSLELLELAFGDRETHIGQAEELAAAAAYWTYPEVVRDSYPIHFVDNKAPSAS